MCGHLESMLEVIPSQEGGLTEGTKKVLQAFAKDFTDMDKKMKSLSDEFKVIKSDVAEMKINVSNMSGKIDTIKDLIESRLNSNVDEDRLTGAVVNRLTKSKKLWIILLVILGLFILAGVAISFIISNPSTTQNLSTVASSVAQFK